MQAFGDEGLSYLETQVSPAGFVNPDGSAISPEQAVDILRERLQTADALATGVTVRMQVAILRFSPTAEDSLRKVYKFVHDNSDMFVAVNMVGREDNDKGYPLRFLQTLRELRRQFGGVKLSIGKKAISRAQPQGCTAFPLDQRPAFWPIERIFLISMA